MIRARLVLALCRLASRLCDLADRIEGRRVVELDGNRERPLIGREEYAVKLTPAEAKHAQLCCKVHLARGGGTVA